MCSVFCSQLKAFNAYVFFVQAFLQKEFSEENLIFWLACEKYKTLENEKEVGNLET